MNRTRTIINKYHEDEIKKIITIVWKVFTKHRHTLRGSYHTFWKRKVCNQCLLTSLNLLTWNAETNYKSVENISSDAHSNREANVGNNFKKTLKDQHG